MPATPPGGLALWTSGLPRMAEAPLRAPWGVAALLLATADALAARFGAKPSCLRHAPGHGLGAHLTWKVDHAKARLVLGRLRPRRQRRHAAARAAGHQGRDPTRMEESGPTLPRRGRRRRNRLGDSDGFPRPTPRARRRRSTRHRHQHHGGRPAARRTAPRRGLRPRRNTSGECPRCGFFPETMLHRMWH